MIEKGIVYGPGDTLALKNAVTRAEFTALLVRALGLEETAYNGTFSDGGLFAPQGTALREQAFAAVARLLQK